MGRRTVRLAGAVGALIAYVTFVRPWQLRWGATDEEIRADLAGDDLIPDPDLVATRAIGIRAPADHVWPWIAQMGQGRGGFYSYDALENLVGCDIRSATRIVPEWQDVAVGDGFRLHPDISLRVARVDPGRALVVSGGVPVGDAAPPYDFCWAFVLREAPDGSTRLLARERYRYTRPWSALLVEPIELLSFLMSQKMLRGIRDRAEGRCS
jgi:hypothetical protein